MSFFNQHLLSIEQLNPDSAESLFNLADKMSPYTNRQKISKVLDGAILCNLFFEPSTRTRLSFGSAFNLLGGNVRETTGEATSSISKGESLYDTAKAVSHYSDIIVMRHPKRDSVKEFSRGSNVPVINGGDGANEHPTQALLDLYTIRNELKARNKSIHKAHIVFIGDLKHSRTVHSLCKALCYYKGLKITFISPDELQAPANILSALEKNELSISTTNNLSENFNCTPS